MNETLKQEVEAGQQVRLAGVLADALKGGPVEGLEALFKPAVTQSLDGTIHVRLAATRLEDFNSCPFKFAMAHQEGWENGRKAPAQSYGHLIHKCMGHLLTAHKAFSSSEVLDALHCEIDGHFHRFPMPEGEWRTAERAKGLVEEFFRAVPRLPFEEVLTVERKENIALWEVWFDPERGRLYDRPAVGTTWAGVRVTLTVVLDALVRWNGRLWALDWKTDKGGKSEWWDSAGISPQFKTYDLATRLLYPSEDVAGVLVCRLITREPHSNWGLALPRWSEAKGQWFSPMRDSVVKAPFEVDGPRPLLYSQEQSDEFRGVLWRHVESLLRYWSRDTWFESRNEFACGQGEWRCAFYNYCHASPPHQRGAVLQGGTLRRKWENPVWVEQQQQREEI